ncbi:hypothetical protein LCGC14_3078690, partial [marine sediment metagenome]
VVFMVVPVYMVGHFSLQKTNYVFTEYVGLKNYVDAFRDPDFIQAVLNNFLYAAILVPMATGLPLTIALASYNMTFRVQDFIRFIYYVPSLASGLVIYGVWKWILDYRKGLINHLLGLVGIQPVFWLGQRFTAILVICVMLSIMWMGGKLIMYMAVMRSVPMEMCDTARVDGATWFQVKMRIILPQIMPWVLFSVLLTIIASFQIWAHIYTLTAGGPAGGTTTVLYNIYETGFIRSQYGVASARSLMLMMLLLAIAVLKRIIERGERYE